MSVKKFRRAYAQNHSFKFDAAGLKDLADEVVYACERPLFDDLTGPEHEEEYEGAVKRAMKDYDPDKDVIVFYGDAMIFAMMIFCAHDFLENWASGDKSMKVARFSVKSNSYVIRELTYDQFD